MTAYSEEVRKELLKSSRFGMGVPSEICLTPEDCRLVGVWPAKKCYCSINPTGMKQPVITK